MAVKGEILFKTSKGGELAGPRENKSSLIYEFSHEVYLPYEKEENKVQGSRRLRAFEVVKAIDPLTPQLYQVACTGELCPEVKVTLYRINNDNGEEEPYFNYTLADAKIVSIMNWMPPTYIPENEGIGHLEKISILAREFTWEYIEGGVTYTEQSF